MYTKQAADNDNLVISPGGGVVIRPENITVLKKNGKVFYLRAHIATLLKRVGEDPTRPALTTQKTQKEEMEEVLSVRKNLYEHAADYIIDTDSKTEQQVAEEIIKNL
jgi:shikimate kinase